MRFNGVNFGEYVVVEHIRRTLLPTIESHNIKVPGKDGEILLGRSLGPTRIEVDLRFIHDNKIDLEERVRLVAGLLHTDKDEQLILRDDPERYVMASVEGEPQLDTYLGIGLVTVTFVCNDPRAYSLDEKKVDLPGEFIYGGTRPGFGAIEIKVTEPINELVIEKVDSGEFVKIEADLEPNEVVKIDFEREYLTIDDTNAMSRLTLDSTFFGLTQGFNSIDISSGIGKIIFRERWI